MKGTQIAIVDGDDGLKNLVVTVPLNSAEAAAVVALLGDPTPPARKSRIGRGGRNGAK